MDIVWSFFLFDIVWSFFLFDTPDIHIYRARKWNSGFQKLEQEYGVIVEKTWSLVRMTRRSGGGWW